MEREFNLSVLSVGGGSGRLFSIAMRHAFAQVPMPLSCGQAGGFTRAQIDAVDFTRLGLDRWVRLVRSVLRGRRQGSAQSCNERSEKAQSRNARA